MKKKIVISLLFSLVIFIRPCMSQSIERSVVASAGDYYESANVSLSWTLGEIATETYSSANNILTQGFQQPDISLVSLVVDLKEFLSGPFVTNQMTNSLNTSGFLPLSHPYSVAPWNYPGPESVASIPGTEIVDWVLIELRDAPSAPQANISTRIARQAAFVKRNGEIVATDGSSNLSFNVTVNDQLYAIVWHRNHLGVMSANALQQTGGVYTYNFTSGQSQVYGGSLGHKQLASSAWGMVSGDGNGDGFITNTDKLQVWQIQTGLSGYYAGDFNLNGQVNNEDKLNYWRPNSGFGTQIP